MFKILKKRVLADKLVSFVIEAKKLATSAKPGQFLIVRIDEKGERVPLTICDYDKEMGTITIVVQEIGVSTKKLNTLNEGDYLLDVVGPLGNPSDLVDESLDELNKKKIIFVAGGLGAAPVYPQAKYLSDRGIKFDVIIGAKSKNLLILEDEFKKLNCNLYICTDDESYAFKGPVTRVLKMLCDGSIGKAKYLDKNGNELKGSDIYGELPSQNYNHCVAIGSAIMMKYLCMTTEQLDIKTIVSMNMLMVDGTGMCGACRLMVGDKLKFCCVDGPEFDGHLINFDEVMKRQMQYIDEESRALLKYNEKDTHSGSCGVCK